MITVPQGCGLGITTGGDFLARVHYTADPSKRYPGYREVGRPKMGIREWDREMEMKDDVWDGLPIFPDYNDDHSCPLSICRDRRLPVLDRGMWWGCWDAGQTVNPAFLLLQVTEKPFQVHALQELLVMEGGEDMEKFAPRVMMLLMSVLPRNWENVYHIGDPTINTRDGSTGKTAAKVAKETCNIHIKPGIQSFFGSRYPSASWMVRNMIDDLTPRLLVDGIGCPVLRAGFKGAYQWKTPANTDLTGPGAKYLEPRKDGFSHIQDAFQYGAVSIKKFIETGRL